jgi:phytoene dehydrogenase-like protein
MPIVERSSVGNDYDVIVVGGSIFHGELSASQLFHARSAAGYADLRTPIRGRYQAGSGTHGGGGVTGIPGRNAVTQVLRDLRRARLRSRFGRR